MTGIQCFDIPTLLRKGVNDEYNYTVSRAGSLTDFMSGLCAMLGKIVTIALLLIVAFQSARTVFYISLTYVVAAFVANIILSKKAMENMRQFRTDQRRAEYVEKLPLDPGVAKEIRVFRNTESIHSFYNFLLQSLQKRRGICEVI